MQHLFEWDEDKAQANRRKHGVSFDEAMSVFADTFSVTIPDPGHSEDEDRYVDIGTLDRNRVLIVVYTEREGRNSSPLPRP